MFGEIEGICEGSQLSYPRAKRSRTIDNKHVSQSWLGQYSIETIGYDGLFFSAAAQQERKTQ